MAHTIQQRSRSAVDVNGIDCDGYIELEVEMPKRIVDVAATKAAAILASGPISVVLMVVMSWLLEVKAAD